MQGDQAGLSPDSMAHSDSIAIIGGGTQFYTQVLPSRGPRVQTGSPVSQH